MIHIQRRNGKTYCAMTPKDGDILLKPSVAIERKSTGTCTYCLFKALELSIMRQLKPIIRDIVGD